MANLSAVVQQLKKERANAQRVVGRLDAALKALKGIWALGTPSRAHGERCQLQPGGKLLLPKERGGQR